MADRTAAEWAEEVLGKCADCDDTACLENVTEAFLAYGEQERRRALEEAAALAESFDRSVNFGLALATCIRALATRKAGE